MVQMESENIDLSILLQFRLVTNRGWLLTGPSWHHLNRLTWWLGVDVAMSALKWDARMLIILSNWWSTNPPAQYTHMQRLVWQHQSAFRLKSKLLQYIMIIFFFPFAPSKHFMDSHMQEVAKFNVDPDKHKIPRMLYSNIKKKTWTEIAVLNWCVKDI